MNRGPQAKRMGPDSFELAERAVRWLGRQLEPDQVRQLARFHDWLVVEAIPGGGIGPNEAARLWSRHIGDSLLFGVVLGDTPGRCIDLGSGAGLPGVPLAILRRDIQFTLVDKSQRRCELLDRIVAVLRLTNCTVVHSDIASVDREWDWLVSRAAMPVQDLLFHVKRLLAKHGSAAIGLSRVPEGGGIEPPDVAGLALEVIEVPAEILDSRVQLLRITFT